MKIYNKLFIGTSICFVVCSCADQGLLPFSGELQVPTELVQNAHLQEYDVLKNYVNRTDNPNFILGVAVDESDFINKGTTYSIAQTNFENVTPGNAMKYSSVVDDNGDMDFSTVLSFIETAQDAGLSIYGHTLCWHSQQNVTYLNGLIAPTIIPGEGGDGGYCLVLSNSAAGTNVYDAQTWYQLSDFLEDGVQYTISFMAKADKAYGMEIYLQSSTGGAQGYPGSVNVDTEWNKVSLNFTPSHASIDKIAFNFGTYAGNIYIDDVELTKSGSSENLISNGDFEEANINGWTGWTPGKFEKISDDGQGYTTGGGEPTWSSSIITNTDFENGISGWSGWGGSATREQSQAGEGYNSDYSFKITNPEKTTNSYDVQVAWDFSSPLVSGGTYRLKMMIKGTTEGSIGANLQKKSNYAGAGDFSNVTIGTEWTEYESQVVVSGDGADNADRFLLNLGHYVGTIYIDDVTFCYLQPDGSGGQTIEKTDEEKHDIIYAALEDWIKNMMENCAGNVKVWDVVNEPMSDGNPYALKHYETESADSRDNCFYWQDYLGDNYARDAVALARKYFAEYGGNPEELKLFVNDYNLEASYNSNNKCKGLIQMIQQWESDGETVIDGIGTQMHVSCSLNLETQQKNEDAVVNMLTLLANTGKLIKISEIDMGITDENGDKILTTDVTYVQLLHMADYYNFIIRKYFEIIPANQRYGITQWSITDAGDQDYAWRKSEPIGLWTSSYNRKPAYAGFADGLAGTEKSYLEWNTEENSDKEDNTSGTSEE